MKAYKKALYKGYQWLNMLIFLFFKNEKRAELFFLSGHAIASTSNHAPLFFK
ncbi:hypothetical protein JCM15457_2551 [Liquorilactobacillus sucicola DSM 21376 = JCM 15457]|uniref:Uncharacterized protein n=1 Tax=Liquorilactobacillus sucicola DSM 21376 = JCM 15457 TaxID=1423806 RepID=A0A023D051_9LACO|nr:hypothetical protein FD15_GL002294 [Liquorilactobacillus sucicola DSM 21376 = JCM 15457]GAJ27548.1 hypothetical protein JCM15457_2551 [Liquorilactobacillus sucicola DSM 21376 = JCM 15457]